MDSPACLPACRPSDDGGIHQSRLRGSGQKACAEIMENHMGSAALCRDGLSVRLSASLRGASPDGGPVPGRNAMVFQRAGGVRICTGRLASFACHFGADCQPDGACRADGRGSRRSLGKRNLSRGGTGPGGVSRRSPAKTSLFHGEGGVTCGGASVRSRIGRRPGPGSFSEPGKDGRRRGIHRRLCDKGNVGHYFRRDRRLCLCSKSIR